MIFPRRNGHVRPCLMALVLTSLIGIHAGEHVLLRKHLK